MMFKPLFTRPVVLLALSTQIEAQPSKTKLDTEISPGIATPDRLETRLGKLTAFHGVPDEKTTQLAYDNLNFQRATQVFPSTIQIASMYAIEQGLWGLGPLM